MNDLELSLFIVSLEREDWFPDWAWCLHVLLGISLSIFFYFLDFYFLLSGSLYRLALCFIGFVF